MTRCAPWRVDRIRWRSRSMHRDKGLTRCCDCTVTLQACLQQRLEGADSLQLPELLEAVAFAGPFGALLRWQLAGWNSALPGRLGWFPAGTFAANFLACVAIFVVEVRPPCCRQPFFFFAAHHGPSSADWRP